MATFLGNKDKLTPAQSSLSGNCLLIKVVRPFNVTFVTLNVRSLLNIYFNLPKNNKYFIFECEDVAWSKLFKFTFLKSIVSWNSIITSEMFETLFPAYPCCYCIFGGGW